DQVIIESKDDITAGDGLRHNVISGKGALSTETTANCFRLLNAHGIPTHFIDTISPSRFLARRADMIPLEVVTRRIVTGSYLKRHPQLPDGARLDDLQVEFFVKDDAEHDPMVELMED